jgi:hypothetical protein
MGNTLNIDGSMKDINEVAGNKTIKCYVVYSTEFSTPDTTEVKIENVFFNEISANVFKGLLEKEYSYHREVFMEESEIEL